MRIRGSEVPRNVQLAEGEAVVGFPDASVLAEGLDEALDSAAGFWGVFGDYVCRQNTCRALPDMHADRHPEHGFMAPTNSMNLT